MQKKFNIILWCSIPVMFFFFIGLTIWNQNMIRKYEYQWKEKDHTIQVSVYARGTQDWDSIFKYIKKEIKVDGHIDTAMEQIKKLLNTESYIIQIDEHVMVGTYYQEGSYQVATTYSDQTLFKILNVEKKSMMVEKVNHDEFDKMIVLATTPEIAKTLFNELKGESVESGIKIVSSKNDVEVYWLYGNNEVNHVKGKHK